MSSPMCSLMANVILLVRIIPAALVDASRGNHETIILVHGWLGWGPGEMNGFKYWGGANDIAQELQAVGHDVRTAVVGPVSSNWDRACELYAYIKGGKVDYGATHSKKFNHSRYGSTFPGIYPEWGTAGADGSLRRVHLVGHSMGGQTARVLLRFLSRGDPDEQEPGASPLFKGGHSSWIHSISTVNTPHDGTTIDGKALGTSFVKGVAWPLLKGLFAIEDLFSDDLPYDFKLGQFGLERQNGEGFIAYAERIRTSSIWKEGFQDFSAYDLSRHGARELNRITPAEKDVYYFSYASMDTHETLNPFSKHQVPNTLMWAVLWPFGYAIGSTGNESLWPNDGVVNTISQNGPKLGSHDSIVRATKHHQKFRPGVWNYMGLRDGVDHLENVGMGIQPVQAYYRDIAARIASLPDLPSRASAAFAEASVLI